MVTPEARATTPTTSFSNDNTPVYLTKAQLEQLVIKIVNACKGS